MINEEDGPVEGATTRSVRASAASSGSTTHPGANRRVPLRANARFSCTADRGGVQDQVLHCVVARALAKDTEQVTLMYPLVASFSECVFPELQIKS